MSLSVQRFLLHNKKICFSLHCLVIRNREGFKSVESCCFDTEFALESISTAPEILLATYGFCWKASEERKKRSSLVYSHDQSSTWKKENNILGSADLSVEEVSQPDSELKFIVIFQNRKQQVIINYLDSWFSSFYIFLHLNIGCFYTTSIILQKRHCQRQV